MTSPVLISRYAREMSLSVDDIKRNDERRRRRQKQLESHYQKTSIESTEAEIKARTPKVTFGTQTDFRYPNSSMSMIGIHIRWILIVLQGL